MSKFATKAADSPFYLARMEASKVNDRLASREGAADETGIDRSRMARVDPGEDVQMGEILAYMKNVATAAEAMQLWIKKNLKGEACNGKK